jgi:formate dehydrogenase major subunit
MTNFLMLQGNLGKPGAGVCPVRGHSNVQGDRLWEFGRSLQQPFWMPCSTLIILMYQEHGYHRNHSSYGARAG